MVHKNLCKLHQISPPPPSSLPPSTVSHHRKNSKAEKQRGELSFTLMESMDCGSVCSSEKGTQKISVSDQNLNMKSDSFHVDMEPISHLNKDSRFHLQRNLSRKLEDKKMSYPGVENEGDANSSPRAREGMIEPQVHHQITIITSGTAATAAVGTPKKSRLIGKRLNSFKQTPVINPRRILFFFATLSSLGTILLICLTLSMAKHNGEDNLLNE